MGWSSQSGVLPLLLWLCPRRGWCCVWHTVPAAVAHCNPTAFPNWLLGLSSLGRGRAQDALGCVQAPPRSLHRVRAGWQPLGAQPALAGDRDPSSGICSIPCTSPVPVGRRLCLCIPPPAPPAQGLLPSCGNSGHSSPRPSVRGVSEVPVNHPGTRYGVTRVLRGTGFSALSLHLGERDPLLTLLWETPRSPWQLNCGSANEPAAFRQGGTTGLQERARRPPGRGECGLPSLGALRHLPSFGGPSTSLRGACGGCRDGSGLENEADGGSKHRGPGSHPAEPR